MFKKLVYHYYWYALFVIMIRNNSCPLKKKFGRQGLGFLLHQFYSITVLSAAPQTILWRGLGSRFEPRRGGLEAETILLIKLCLECAWTIWYPCERAIISLMKAGNNYLEEEPRWLLGPLMARQKRKEPPKDYIQSTK